VFQKINSSDQKRLDRAVRAMNMKTLKRTVKEQSVEMQASHRVLHLRVDPDDLTEAWPEFGSDYIRDEVTRQALMDEKQQLIDFLKPLSAGDSNSVRGTVRGAMFESLAHIRLEAGGSFRVRWLQGSTPAEYIKYFDTSDDTKLRLCVPSSNGIFFFQSLDGVFKQPDGVYCRPRATTHPSVDALQQPGWMFQMTISVKSKVVARGLRDAIGVLRGFEEQLHPVFIIVAPSDLFEAVKPLTVTATAGFDEQQAASIGVKMPQWVLSFDDI
jgi:hypothetical protein